MCHQVVFRVTVVLCMHIMHAASRQRASAGRLILSFCMILGYGCFVHAWARVPSIFLTSLRCRGDPKGHFSN